MKPTERERQFIEYMQDYQDDDLDLYGGTYSKIEVLRQIDPVAYRQGYLSWLDNEEMDED